MQVFRTIEAIEVYVNEYGDVVLSQEDRFGGEDSYVYIPLAHFNAVVKEMRVQARMSRDSSVENES